jgi:hypothetical protein
MLINLGSAVKEASQGIAGGLGHGMNLTQAGGLPEGAPDFAKAVTGRQKCKRGGALSKGGMH